MLILFLHLLHHFPTFLWHYQHRLHVSWSHPCSLELCQWLNSLCCKNERRLPSFCLPLLSRWFSLFFLSIIIVWRFTEVPVTFYYFYACFCTSWAWNKDTILLYYTQCCAVHKSTTCTRCTHVKVRQTHELTFVTGHVKACLHFWKFATWRFICWGLTV